MKKAAAFLVGVVLLIVFLVVLLAGNDECADERGVDGDSSVPPGSYSKPEVMPPGVVTSGFGIRWGAPHNGLDISSGMGTPIYAYADGTVTNSGPATGFGQWIVITHQADDGSRFDTVYGHMYPQDLLVHVGDKVRAGQQIAREGSNGQSTGSHVHFEVHPGGWGNPVDPAPWVDKAVNPSTGVDMKTEHTVKLTPDVTEDGDELKPASEYGVQASEEGLRRDTIRLQRMIAKKFPDIKVIGGYRPSDPFPDHPDGRALDVMIPSHKSSSGVALGNHIKDWAYINRNKLNVDYVIWRQTSYNGDGVARKMEDRGGDTANHYDHVHITLNSSPYPDANEQYNEVTGLSNDGSYTMDGNCEGHGDEHADLAPGTVPPEFEPWLAKGAAVCEEVDAPLLAAQLKQESGFQKGAVSQAGAMGYAQFMPGTWASYGYAVDEDGNRVGAAGAGDPNDVGAAVMAQANYMCDIAARAKPKIASGQWQGVTVREAMLAGFNAGEGNVDKYGGIPPFEETINYVAKITADAKNYAR